MAIVNSAVAINNEMRTAKYRQRFNALQADVNTWKPHWSEVREFFAPRRGRYLGSDTEQANDGTKKTNNTINGIAFEASDGLASLLQSGLCPRTLPWFALSVSDRQVSEDTQVKQWLSDTRDVILSVLEKSNFYNASFSVLKEFGTFGVGAMFAEQDFNNIVRFRAFTIGEYFIGVDAHGVADTLYRRFALNARQIIKEFGVELVSQDIKTAFETNSTNLFTLIHAIQPNDDFNPTLKVNTKMKWEEVYFEERGNQDNILKKGGYRTCPFTAPRWEVSANDSYGDSPGIRTLSDVKMLQKIEELKLKAINKEVDPPLNIPTVLRGKGASLVAGGANYVDTNAGQSGVSPVMLVRPDLRNTAIELDRIEKRINHSMYVDLLEMLLDDTKRRTATEITQKNSDRLQKLGPAIGRILTEYLNPTLNRVYDIVDDFGGIPPMPEILMGVNIKIEYVSQLAVTMKVMQRVRPIQEFLGNVGMVAQFVPTAVNKINGGEMVDVLADALGVPPSCIRSDEEVAQIVAAQQAAAQQQQQLENAAGAVDSAQKLSSTPIGNGSALDEVMDGLDQSY